MTRKYSTTSVATAITTTISNTSTTIAVTAGTGTTLMGGVSLAAGNVDQFLVALDVDTQNEEIVAVTAVSGDTLTVVRARAGTSGISHTAGATVKHVFTGDDATFFTAGVATANSASTTATAAIPKSVVSAKGDLIVATSSAIPNRIAVGLDTYILTADNAQSTGIKWAAPAVPTLDITFNAQTGTTYTIVLADKNKLVTLNNAAAITLTIPSGIFTVGQVVNIQQIGVGQVTVVSNGTSVITSTGATPGSPKLRTRYSAATILCTSSNNFTVLGDIS